MEEEWYDFRERRGLWAGEMGAENKTTRVGFSANGMFVESLAEVDLDGQVNEFKLYGILVFKKK